MRKKLLAGIAALGLMMAGCGTVAATSSTTAPPPHKVLVIMEENHSLNETKASMPYLTGLGKTYGQATNYFALHHPSLPNYLDIFGGSTFGVTDDCGVGCVPSNAAPSVYGQTIAAHKTAKVYAESMPSNCATGDSGGYAPRHVPWPYWTNTTERNACKINDVPMGSTTSGNFLNNIKAGTLPVTGEAVPNLCNDAHDCSLGTADGWLHKWVPILMNGPDYKAGHLTIIITFDEDDGSQSNHVAFVVVDPRLHNKVVTLSGTHFSLLRWLDENAGVSLLRNASTAHDLKVAFGI